MKKVVFLLGLLLLPTLFFGGKVLAADPNNPAQAACFTVNPDGSKVQVPELSESSLCKASNENPIAGKDGVIMRVVGILSWVIGVASVIIIMLGGLKYITANGDSNGINSAKNTIMYAVIGLVIFVLSQAIVRFVAGRL